MRSHRLPAAVRCALGVLCGALAPVVSACAQAPADTAVRVTFGGFADVYFAYDFGRPPAIDRAFTTQAARHSEFNVNLAYVDAVLTGPRLRGRLAFQFGTAVQANYAGEPTVGALSGASVSRFIQEATIGYQVSPTVWIDGGVFFSPFGSENWISRDNWTYTRSLIADYSPYYEAGIKATWQATPTLSAQLHVINGWQNISETNSDKAIGVRLDWKATPRLTLAYDGFAGNEQPDSLEARLRLFHDVIVKYNATDRLAFSATHDFGTQPRSAAQGGGVANWSGFAVLARFAFTPRLAVAGRVEGYDDPEQVIVATGGTRAPLRATGASVTVDVMPHPKLLWRSELRVLQNAGPLFPSRSATGLSRTNTGLMTSLALTF